MDLLHRWPILVLALATAACIVILLWILINFIRESRAAKGGSPPLGSRRDPHR
jgi:hypothetical protein